MATVGYLHSGTEDMFLEPFAELQKAMPGVAIKPIYANDDKGILKAGAEELVEDGVAGRLKVIVAAGGPEPAVVLQKETEKRKPDLAIVFTTVADPDKLYKLVDSLDRPGRNATGMAGQTSELDPERLEKLYDLVEAIQPRSRVGVLIQAGREHADIQQGRVEDKARELEVVLRPRKASTVPGIESAFDFFEQQGVKGVVVTADSFFNNHRNEVVAYANAKRLPTIYQWKEFVDAGGLISHAPSILEAYKKAGEYVMRILGGDDPATMPCSRPSRPKTYVNAERAKELDIKVPPPLADDSVELPRRR
jgi:putative tryptophan/tyrosine transport system substrate-binding protein